MLAVVLGYLIGSFPSGYLASRLFKKADIRKLGDRNVGAANVYNQVGIGAGLAVFLVDIGKGAAAVLLAQMLTSSQAYNAGGGSGSGCRAQLAGIHWL